MSPKERLGLLKSEEFDFDIPPTSSPRILRELLRARSEVQLLKRELANGQLAEQTVRQFVNDLMQYFVRGKRFAYETALAATAVVFEDYFSPYAEEFLMDLAALRLSEIALARQVAGLCLHERVTKCKTKVFDSEPRGHDFEMEPAGWVSLDTRLIHTSRPTQYATA